MQVFWPLTTRKATVGGRFNGLIFQRRKTTRASFYPMDLQALSFCAVFFRETRYAAIELCITLFGMKMEVYTPHTLGLGRFTIDPSGKSEGKNVGQM